MSPFALRNLELEELDESEEAPGLAPLSSTGWIDIDRNCDTGLMVRCLVVVFG